MTVGKAAIKGRRRSACAAGGVLLLLSLVASAADELRRRSLFMQECALCHGRHAEGAGQGPDLRGVVGRSAAATNFAYTEALRASKLRWTADELDRFLTAPTRVVPGTTMVIAVPDAKKRRDLIAFFSSIQAGPAKAPESSVPAPAVQPGSVFSDWRSDVPGTKRYIKAADLPAPYATQSANNEPSVVAQPQNAILRVPPGFTVKPFGKPLSGPRVIRVAPNGDLFVTESRVGRIRVIRTADGADQPTQTALFAEGLDLPHGMAFYPAGADPQWLYVANTNSVIRFPYRNGDLKPRGPAQVIVSKLAETSGGHPTRDIAFSKDGNRMFVAVGSASNVAEDMPKKSAADIRRWESAQGLGAAWGPEADRAGVLVFDPEGKARRTFANGIRNCVGLAVSSASGELWCATNERDELGDDLVPDYATRVRDGAFYGWPWYYIGSNEDPRHAGRRVDLAGKVTAPDVLFQPHAASLNIAFYEATDGVAAFPAEYRGDAFVTFHGSWNRQPRTGSKVVRVRMSNDAPTGEYEDFLTGFGVDDDRVWGRLVGVAVAHDGALIVGEDGNGALWRVSH